MGILIYILIFLLGIFVGFLIKRWLVRRASYSGTIYVTHDQEKTLYSLELADYPEKLEFKKEVVFKVDASEENIIRE